jgi:hypothetical protein
LGSLCRLNQVKKSSLSQERNHRNVDKALLVLNKDRWIKKSFMMGKPIKSKEGIRGRQITGSRPDHDGTSAEYTLERPYVVWSPDWSIVCLSCQFYDIWEWNPRKALRRVTESLIHKLFCKMLLKKNMFWGSRPSPLPYRQVKIKKWMAGTSLDVSSDISVACKPLRWAGTCMDNQPPCYYEACLERINCFD